VRQATLQGSERVRRVLGVPRSSLRTTPPENRLRRPLDAVCRALLEEWRCEYNSGHLHSSLGHMTPAEFAAVQAPTAVLVPA
jgi:transposase InsO family protein